MWLEVIRYCKQSRKVRLPMHPETSSWFLKIFQSIFVNKEIKCHLHLLLLHLLLLCIPHRNLLFRLPLSGNGSQPLRFCSINLTCNKNTVKSFEVSLGFGHWSASLFRYSATNWISWGILMKMSFISGQLPLQMCPQPLSPILFPPWVLKYVLRWIHRNFHSPFER